MSMSMDRTPIMLAASCFSRQDVFNDTHDDPNGPTLKAYPAHGQGYHITIDFMMCGVIGCPRKTFFRLCKLINWLVVLPRANNKHAKFHRDLLRFGPPRPPKVGDPLFFEGVFFVHVLVLNEPMPSKGTGLLHEASEYDTASAECLSRVKLLVFCMSSSK